MNITLGRKEDDISKFFDDKNAYVGYMDDAGTVFYVGSIYAEPLGTADNGKEAIVLLKARHGRKSPPTVEQHLIMTMAAKLACYDPNSELVKKALNYLERL